MDNETKQMFEILMKKLDNIEESQKEMKETQNGMQQSQMAMEKTQIDIIQSQKAMEKTQIDMQQSQKNMEIRQNKIFSVVNAIEHSNTIHKAEIDNITYKVAHTEGTINKIGEVISERRLIK